MRNGIVSPSELSDQATPRAIRTHDLFQAAREPYHFRGPRCSAEPGRGAPNGALRNCLLLSLLPFYRNVVLCTD